MRLLARTLTTALERLTTAGRVPARTEPPRAPEGLRIYAIGDIHGERELLDRMLDAVVADAARSGTSRPVAVFLGDYIDRGPESCAVLDRLCGDPLPGFEIRFLLGNHEAAMLDFLRDPAAAIDWLQFGGIETLASYGVRASLGASDRGRSRRMRDQLESRVPDEHVAFLKALEPSCVYGDYAFVHAGIRPGRALARQTLDDLLWIREPFLGWTRPHEKVIVHGHTVVEAPERRDNRIGVDTGAYASGRLTAAVLSGAEQAFLDVSR